MKHTKNVKKWIAIGLTICMTAGIFLNIPASIQAADTTISIENGNFSGNVTNRLRYWDAGTDDSATQFTSGSEGSIFNKNYYMEISRSKASSSSRHIQNSTVSTGSMSYGLYELSYKYYGKGGSMAVYPLIVGDNTWNHYQEYAVSSADTGGWVKRKMYFIAEAWSSSCSVGFVAMGGAGTCWIDDVELVKKDEMVEFSNSGFQSGIDGWNVSGASGEADTTQFHDGAGSLHVTCGNTGYAVTVNPTAPVKVTGSRNYVFRIYVKSKNAKNSKIRILGELTDRSTGRDKIQGVEYVLNADSALSDWTPVDLRLTGLDENKTYLLLPKVVISEGSSEIYLDDVQLIQEETAYETHFAVTESGSPDGWKATGNASFGDKKGILTGTDDVLTGRWENVRGGNSYQLCADVSAETEAKVIFYRDNGTTISSVSAQGTGTVTLDFTAPSCAYASILLHADGASEITRLSIEKTNVAAKAKPSVTKGEPAYKDSTELPTTEIKKDENGNPMIYFNGDKLLPSIYLRGDAESTVQYGKEYGEKLTDAGMDIIAIPLYLNGHGNCSGVWTAENTYDFSKFDEIVYQTLAGAESAKLLLQVDATPPQWWLDANPEERSESQDQDGNKSYEGVSYSSEKWRQDIKKAIEAFVAHVNQKDYAYQVLGVRMTAGPTYEWQYWGAKANQAVDFSTASLNGFRTWLRKNYGDDVSALQTAWGDTSVTFDTAAIPTYAERGGTQAVLSAAQRKTVDYHLFLCDAGADALLDFAKTIKEASNGKWIVGSYNGYVTPAASSEIIGTAHMAIDRLLASEDVDFICAPYNYGARQSGMSAGYMTMVDSITQAGKLFIMECDNRTALYDYGSDFSQVEVASWGQTYTMEDSLNQMKRDFANVITHGAGLWWYGMIGEWFDDEQMYSMMRTCNVELANAVNVPKTKNEIAWIVDEDMLAYVSYDMDASSQWLQEGFEQQMQNLANTGCGYDMYYMSSLEREIQNGNIPDYKVYLISGLDFDENERAVIKNHLEKNGSTVIFTWMAGAYNRDTNSFKAENIQDVTGMTVTIDTSNAYAFAVDSTDYGVFGNASGYAVSPMAYVTGGYETELGKLYGTTDKIGFAGKTLESGCKVYYSATAVVPAAFLRKMTGTANVYDANESDAVFAGNGYLGINTAFGGTRTLTLGGNYHVYNVFSGQYAGKNVDTVNVTLRPGETVLYRLEQASGGFTDTFTSLTEEGNIGQWHMTFDNGMTSSASIAEEGHDEAGSLHYVRKDARDNPTDSIYFEAKDAATGDYTLTLWMKGNITYAPNFTIWQVGRYDTEWKPLSEGTTTIGDWTKYSTTISINADSGYPLFAMVFGGYVGDTDLYIDNVSLTKADGTDVLGGKGNFCKAYELATLAESSTGATGWYRDWPGTADNENHSIKISTKGSKDPGALHIYSAGVDGDKSDMYATISQHIPAGTYTIKMQVKGTVALTDQCFRFEKAGSDAYIFDIVTQNEYRDWTEVSGSFETDDAYYYRINYSQYNWATDFYIDNIQILDANGIDMLEGKGSFCTEAENADAGGENMAYVPVNLPVGYAGSNVWYQGESVTNDTELVLSSDGTHGNILALIKGDRAQAGSGRAALTSENINVESQKTYELSFDIKGEGTRPWFWVTGYFYGEGKEPQEFVSECGGDLTDTWSGQNVSVTVPERYQQFQLRIRFNGAPGDIMCADNIQLREAAKAITLYESDTAGEWYRNDAGTTTYTDIHYMEIVDNGYESAGALHVKHENPDQGDMAVALHAPNSVPGGTYQIRMWVKGTVALSDQNFCFQTAGDDANRFDIVAQTAYGDWTEVTGTFTTGGGTYFVISFSKYNWATDFYIDQIQLLDANGVDVLEGKGDFCTKAGENLIPDGDMESLTHDTLENWQIQNGSVENVLERTYGGNAVRLSANTGDAYMTYMGTAMTGDTKNSVRIYGSFLEGERALAKLICTNAGGTVTEYSMDSLDPKNTETYVKAGKWILFSRTIVLPTGTTVQAAYGAAKGTSTTFDNLGVEILEDTTPGDVNASGACDSADIVRLKKCLANSKTYLVKHVSDLDGTGTIDDADTVALRRLLVK